MAESPLAAAAAARYLALTTFRRDGSAVTTPVWPVRIDGRLVVGTTTNTGKVKRLRRDDRVRLAPCSANGSRILGEWVEGRAHLVHDEELGAAYMRAGRAKYGWQFPLIMALYRLRGLYKLRVLLEIEPEPAAPPT